MPTAGNQLQLSFGINAPQSRAIFTDTKLPDGSPVGVRLDGYADYANLVYTGSTTSGTKQTWSSTTTVTLTETKCTLYAYWPQNNAVSIDAIDVDMTATDQTDWLYATPVADVNKNKASVAVTMNHALANINVKVNKGSYKGAGAISNITLQSDGIALGGTFNAAQTAPGYSAFEDEGKPLSRTVTTTAGAAATDIMVVPSGKSAAITFLLTIDGIQFTATSAAVQLAMGNSYQYTLNLSDISTYMEISGFSVKPWTTVIGGSLALDKVGGGEPLTWENAPNGVYAVSAEGLPVDPAMADNTCIAVAVVDNTVSIPQAFWIEKNGEKNTTTYRNAYNSQGASAKTYDYVYWGPWNSNKIGDTGRDDLLNDFAGVVKSYTIRTQCADYDSQDKRVYPHMGTVLNKFIETTSENQGYNDWYIPATGQAYLIDKYLGLVNSTFEKIGGTKLDIGTPNTRFDGYWTSCQSSYRYAWAVYYSNISYGKGNFSFGIKSPDDHGDKVRFVRDCIPYKFLIDGQLYSADPMMTWKQWLESEYNTLNPYWQNGRLWVSEGRMIMKTSDAAMTSQDLMIGAYSCYTIKDFNTIEGIIKFYINDVPFYAEEGMTWQQFVDSEYCWKNLQVQDGYVYNIGGMTMDEIQGVTPSDVIVAGQHYTHNVYTRPSGGAHD